VWAIRFWLEQEGRLRDRAPFDLAIDGSRADVASLGSEIGDLVSRTKVRDRTPVVQRKTGRPYGILAPLASGIGALFNERFPPLAAIQTSRL
jgi:hypothetical protein